VNHDPTAVAAYLAGELAGRPHSDFEEHLLACEDCWAEVELGRRGRQLAGRAAETAPPQLRQRLVDQFGPGPVTRHRSTPRPDRRQLLLTGAAAAGLAVLGLVAAVLVPDRSPAAIAAAVSEYRADRLPGAGIPATSAPDLSSLGLRQTAAAAGELAGVPVTGYAYRDQLGRRLLVYVTGDSFATPSNAARYEGGDAWLSRDHGVSVLCGRQPHSTLVVGGDEKQVTDAAEYLDLT
jgi:hypothetical protein